MGRSENLFNNLLLLRENGENRLAERRRRDSFEARRERNDIAIEEADLVRRLLLTFEDARVHPPSEESGKIEITKLFDGESGIGGELRDGAAAVAAIVAEVAIDGAIECRKSGDEQHDFSAARKNCGHVAK